jgi:hypothetical protein
MSKTNKAGTARRFRWALKGSNRRHLPCHGMQAILPYQGYGRNLDNFKTFDASRMRSSSDRFAPLRGPNADQI